MLFCQLCSEVIKFENTNFYLVRLLSSNDEAG